MLHYLALGIFGSVFAYQGIQVRKNTPKLAEAEGLREGVLGQGKALSVVIIGDSAAAGVGVTYQEQALAGMLTNQLAADFTVSWELHARSGNTTLDSVRYLSQHERLPKADVVLIALGVNDVIKLNSRKQWLAHTEKLLGLVKKQSSAELILFTKVPPMGLFPALPQPLRWFMGYKANWFNKGLAKWLERQSGCELLGLGDVMNKQALTLLMARDGFHPGEQIYQSWAEIAANSIKMHLEKNANK